MKTKAMNKVHAVLILILPLQILSLNVFAFDNEWDVHVPRGTAETIKHGLLAGAETALTVGSLTAFNYFVQRTPWALPTKKSVHENFTVPWEWEDTDDFAVNQIGHPIQGIFSFGAGRVNGFNFYQSMIFNAWDSFLWEAFGESNHASINDFITTTVASMSVGEIFYRLYIEACAQGVPAPLAFLVNPMVGLHRLFSNWEPPKAEKNLYLLQLYSGIAHAETHYSVPNHEDEIFSFKGPIAEVGANLIYGNPFIQDSKIPYRHFELSISYGLNMENYNHLRIMSDGYLYSFSPLYSATDMLSTGLTMHYDFQTHGKFGMEDGTVDQFSNALDWTLKYQHLFSENTSLQMKIHNGITFFGASEYFANMPVQNDVGHDKTDFNNFGAGINSKMFYTLESGMNRLEIGLLNYVLWTFPGTTHFSRGTVYWLFTDLAYYYRITNHFSLGFMYSYVMENGMFSDGFPDTKKSNSVAKVFIAWNL